jgi:hypothetical protein
MSGLSKPHQIILTIVLAVTLSVLTFAASFAEVPRSEFLPVAVSQN